VSLKLDGQLRGCIGTIAPTTASLAEEIIQNAVSAGYRDPRFDPLEKAEISRLIYSVDVLMKPEPIDSIKELNPKKYGVIVKYKGRSGLLLPDLDGIDTPEDQVRIALRKGNISPEDDYILERFTVTRHH
jgi:AmmeMemoRadiSam system protein A